MSAGDLQATFAATLVDEWARAGVTDAVVCPGSRSTPLALALSRRSGLQVHVRLDERSAGFFALGLAASSGRPVVVCVTSGTAAAELVPAVVEAHLARVPLVVCTADRPPELHGVGAPQTIEQVGIFGAALRWWADPGVPHAGTAWTWRSLGARAVAEAASGPLGPGPVHLNLAFREPLVGEPGVLPPGLPGGEPAHRVALHAGVEELGPWPAARGVIVAGAGCGPSASVLALAEHLGWPLLADPRSRCRVVHPHVVAAADAIARQAPAQLQPEAVVHLGARPSSRALAAMLAGAPAVAVDPWWRWEDPDRRAAVVHRADPSSWLEAAVQAPAPAAPPGWLAGWQDAERAAQDAIEVTVVGGDPGALSEPLVARRLLSWVPEGATVVVASSMPVRDLEWFAPPVASPPPVLANRGANGIDGVTSTALGVAASGRGPVVALVGDLAFFHDVSALAGAAGGVAGSCTLVVVDNGGGGIFEFLPQAGALDRTTFERIFGTPQACDVLSVAAGFGCRTADAATPEELGEAIGAATRAGGLTVVRARMPGRPANAALHDRVRVAVGKALAELAR